MLLSAETICPSRDERIVSAFVVGYHLLFRSYWVDFWKGDRDALVREFGDLDTAREYFGGETRADMVAQYRVDLQRAIDLGAEYVVFHVSDVSLEEVFTYRFAHSDREVIDCAAELVNEVFDGVDAPLALLVESDMFEAHADLGRDVRALHLHQSLSGAYVEDCGFRFPDDFRGTYWEKFSRCYDHILKIDQHQPWSDGAIADVVRRIDPEWVNHELSAWPREPHLRAVARQLALTRNL